MMQSTVTSDMWQSMIQGDPQKFLSILKALGLRNDPSEIIDSPEFTLEQNSYSRNRIRVAVEYVIPVEDLTEKELNAIEKSYGVRLKP